MRNKDTITLCQVSLKRDIPLILKNHQSFKNLYKKIKIFVICPSKDLFFFKDKLDFDKFTIISEDELLSFQKFELIFIKVSENISYKPEFKKRLSWYY